MNQVRISTHDGITELFLNGAPISKKCTGFNLSQEGGEAPVLKLEITCDDVDISGDGVDIKQ